MALGPGVAGSGTSFVAPHVAGVAAIHLELLATSAYQYRTPVDIERNLIGQGTLGVVNGEAGGAPDRFLYSRIPKRRACCS